PPARAADGPATPVGDKRAPGLDLAGPCLSDLRVVDVVRAAEPRRERWHGGHNAENNGEHESARWGGDPRGGCKAGARWFGVTHDGLMRSVRFLWGGVGTRAISHSTPP